MADRLAQTLEPNFSNVFSADIDRSLSDVVHPRNQPDQRALAGTILSDDCDFFACVNSQRWNKERGVLSVAELNRLELQFPVILWKVNGCSVLRYARAQGEHALQLAD